MQNQAEANGNGLRTTEKMLRKAQRREHEASERASRA